ncbi:MAG: Hsp20/alpha crystallin family protein [Nanoarchaeota archaeon]
MQDKKMGFFDDDINDIFSEFFSQPMRKRTYVRQSSEEDERVMDFIEADEHVFFIIELPGYEKEDVIIKVEGRIIQIQAKKRALDDAKEYLAEKLAQGLKYKRTLPEGIAVKKYAESMKNGILELIFDKE